MRQKVKYHGRHTCVARTLRILGDRTANQRGRGGVRAVRTHRLIKNVDRFLYVGSHSIRVHSWKDTSIRQLALRVVHWLHHHAGFKTASQLDYVSLQLTAPSCLAGRRRQRWRNLRQRAER